MCLCLRFKASDEGDAAGGGVADVHECFRAEGEVDVDARAKLDESHVVSYVRVRSLFGVCDDAAGDGACNLAHEHELAPGGADDHRRAFVLGAGLRKVGRHEASGMVGGVNHLAVDRKPVGVHVEYAHEHRQLDAAGLEVFRLVNLL